MRVKAVFFVLVSLFTVVAVVLAVTGFQGNPDRNTVWPAAIDDVLYNPGIGFTTMGRFDGEVPGNPKSTIAYFRWYWEVIEPEDGKYNWALVDDTINKARARGQRVALGVMPANGNLGPPKWYRDMGAKGFEYVPEANAGSDKKNWMPDHNDPLYLKYMGRLVKAFGARYNDHPDVDHIDMRSVGHWGEWHFGFVKPRPTVKPEIRRALVDIYIDNFKNTPLVMLIGGKAELAYAINKGAGWRADCLGDFGFWGADFNHMRDYYQQAIDDAKAHDAWEKSLVTFESCGVMQTWVDKGYDIELVFNEALRWHTSIFNNKSSPVPPRWWGATERFLKRIGYRFVIRYLTLPQAVKQGEVLRIESEWENLGVAPPYRGYVVAFELRPMSGRRLNADDSVRFTSDVDTRKWLPGRQELSLDYKLPPEVKPGRYQLYLALLDPYTKKPSVRLAIEGVDSKLWYGLSEIEIIE
ncbi:DUF4832 domain-containing protein [candidate division KSB1 bacterium]